MIGSRFLVPCLVRTGQCAEHGKVKEGREEKMKG